MSYAKVQSKCRYAVRGLCLGVLVLLVGSAIQARVLVSAVLHAPGATSRETAMETHSAVLWAEPIVHAAGGPPAEPRRIEIELPGEFQIDLAEDSGWQLKLESEDFWSPGGVISPGQSSSALIIYPTAWVRGSLRLVDGAELSTQLEASFRRAESLTTAAIEGRLTCRVHQDRWECRLPVAAWDLRLMAPGFISHFLWSVSVTEGLDLGTLEMRRGSSIFGRVKTEDDVPLAISCQVEAAPQLSPQATVVTQQRAQSRAVLEKVDPRGFFHFQGVAPGAYDVTAAQDGYASAKRQVTVDAGAEVEVEDLILSRPLDFDLRITPPTDLRGGRWKVMLLDLDEMESVGAGTTDAEGRWRIKGLSAGSFVAFVADSEGTKTAEELIELEPGHTSHEVEVPFVWVKGKLLLGDEPLEGLVVFGGVHGSVSIPMQSDAEGSFSGSVSREGKWRVDVKSETPPVFRRLGHIEVLPVGGVAEVELRLPDTVLDGEVVDDAGSPVPGATVIILPVTSREKPSQSDTDTDGKFSVRGHEMGFYRLEARVSGPTDSLVSDTAEVELSEDAPATSVRLVVRPVQQLRGRVIAAGGPVAAATVQVRGLGDAGLLMPSTETDVAGSFTLELPHSIDRAEITVMAAGYALHHQTISSGVELTITLDSQGGTLVLRLPENPLKASSQPRIWVSHEGYLPLDLMALRRWAAMNRFLGLGAEMEVPLMPPGRYTVCWRPSVDAASASRDTCQDGFLPLAGKWEIDLGAPSDETPEEMTDDP